MTAVRQRSAAVVTLALAAGLAVLCAREWPQRFFPAYLAAVLFWTSLPIGAALLLSVHWLAPGRWGNAIRPQAEAAAATSPLALLVLPIIAGARFLIGTNPDHASAQAQLFLRFPFWASRCALYAAAWLILALLLARRSRRVPMGELPPPGLRALAAATLVLFGFTVGFAANDLIAALQPGWTSSVLGLYLLVSYALTALSLLLCITLWPRGQPQPVQPRQDLATMLLTLSVLYIYAAYSQFFITWNGNLPSEVRWYAPRATGGWGVVASMVVVMSFVLPLLALLLRAVKRSPFLLAGVALIAVGGRLLEAGWLVLPVFTPLASWTTALMYALIAFTGVLWVLLYTSAARRNRA